MNRLRKSDRMNRWIRVGISAAVLSAAIVLLPAAADAAEAENLAVTADAAESENLTVTAESAEAENLTVAAGAAETENLTEMAESDEDSEAAAVILKDGEALDGSLSVILADSSALTYLVENADDDSDYTVFWSSSDESVVSTAADQDGGVTVSAKKSGSAVLTLRLTPVSGDGESITAQCTVTVPYQDGFYQIGSGVWYYADSGQIVTSDIVNDSSGVVDGTKNRWWYVCDGRVGCGYTGYAKNKNGWWYVENGYITFSKNSVLYGTVNGTTAWWYVVGSKVKTGFTGLADYPNKYGWWYIENGKVTFTKNTVAKNKNGWYYVTGSKVQFGFTGLANYSNKYGWWYIKNGKVDFTKNTVAKNKNGWYYVTGGKVQFGFTGLANYSNGSGWWYIKAGRVDYTYTGIAKNKNGWWYVNSGKVVFEDALTYAARFVASCTSTSQSSSQKLQTCFNYLWKNYPYKRYYDSPTAATMSNFAVDMFVNKQGNCFRYAASFACIAKVLGYESRVAVGQISSSSGGMTAHGWTEVYVGGTWYICDANMQRNHSSINSYMRTESTYAYKHTCSAHYTLTISNGKAVWK